jgi:TolA-binding protein
MATAQLTNITPPRVPLLDPKTGLVSREWYRFFLSLFVLTGSGQNTASLTDLQVGPPMPTQEDFGEIVISIDSLKTQPSQESALDQIAELQKQIDGLQKQIECPCTELTAELQKQIEGLQKQIESPCTELTAELQKQIEGLQMTPAPREFERSRYGSFYDTTTQTATTINTAQAITFNTTDLSRGVYLGTPTSRVYVDTPGIYNFDTSFQLDKTSGGLAEFYFWFRLNGTDVPDSASQIRIQGNDAEIFSSLNYFFDLNAGDYVEMMFSTTSLSVELLSVPATAPVPGIPSIILTVSNNIGGIQ